MKLIAETKFSSNGKTYKWFISEKVKVKDLKPGVTVIGKVTNYHGQQVRAKSYLVDVYPYDETKMSEPTNEIYAISSRTLTMREFDNIAQGRQRYIDKHFKSKRVK